MSDQRPRVGFFATCLLDLFRPSLGFQAVTLLEKAGCDVTVPLDQTCCGQPAYNVGDQADAVSIAKQVIATFGGFDYVVVPSASCAGMIKKHYPELLRPQPGAHAKAVALGAKTWEIAAFLSEVLNWRPKGPPVQRRVTFHPSCSALRELGETDQSQRLLAAVPGIDFRPLAAPEECCGFGGTFCVKYPQISERMVDQKLADITATGADVVTSGDLGCLMNIAGRSKRTGKGLECRHVVEVLAGDLDTPAVAATPRRD